MDTQEFYIRQASDNEARGPDNLEQLISLSEIGSVTHDTLFYDAGREKWTPIGENADLKKSIFPEKTKLSIKAKSDRTWLNQTQNYSTPEITIEGMMDSAEGRTEETKHKISRKIKDAHNAALGMYAIIAMLGISAAAEILPGVDVIMSLAPSRLVEQPLIILGVLDLLFALFIYLGAVEIYPLVRVRAAVGRVSRGKDGVQYRINTYWVSARPGEAAEGRVGPIEASYVGGAGRKITVQSEPCALTLR
jgi:hypothetical protein